MMGTKYPEIFHELSEPFPPEHVKIKPKGGGQQYVTARTVMNRLDSVLGPENWWDDYIPQPTCVICKLTICLPGGEVITKSDAGGHAGMTDEGDDEKSGYSDAFKRAAVKFGIGRHLYKDGIPRFLPDPPAEPPKTKVSKAMAPKKEFPNVVDVATAIKQHNGPQTKREFAEVLKGVDPAGDQGFIEYIKKWGEKHGHPPRIADWTDEMCRAAYPVLMKEVDATAALA